MNNTYLHGLVWVAIAVVPAALIAYLVRRFNPNSGPSKGNKKKSSVGDTLVEGRNPDATEAEEAVGRNEATGEVFTIVAGLHAVVLAFVLVTLFDNVRTARDDAHEEAQALVAVSWASNSLSPPVQTRVHDLSTAYTRTVIQREWPQMRAGQPVTGPGWGLLDQIRAAIDEAPSADDWQKDRKIEAANELWQVYQKRQARLDGVTSRGVVAVVWFVLIVGTLITILLPNLFDGTKMVTHVLIVSTVAGTLAMLLFAIFELQNPFSGGSEIEPDAFQWAIERLAGPS